MSLMARTCSRIISSATLKPFSLTLLVCRFRHIVLTVLSADLLSPAAFGLADMSPKLGRTLGNEEPGTWDASGKLLEIVERVQKKA